jgi:hypothetical protein
MKTKAILLAGILLTTGIASSTAQVYSVNAVGYVSVTLAPGEFKIICNPLNVVTNGTQNNTLDAILPGAPNNVTKIYRFDPVTQSFPLSTHIHTKRSSGWSPTGSTTTINPGEGFFVQSTALTNITLTFVGEVPQGNLNSTMQPGFQLLAAHIPVAGLAQVDLKLPAINGDIVYLFRSGAYTTHTRRTSSWTGGEPSVNVAEGFYFKSITSTNRTWSNSFTTSI